MVTKRYNSSCFEEREALKLDAVKGAGSATTEFAMWWSVSGEGHWIDQRRMVKINKVLPAWIPNKSYFGLVQMEPYSLIPSWPAPVSWYLSLVWKQCSDVAECQHAKRTIWHLSERTSSSSSSTPLASPSSLFSIMFRAVNVNIKEGWQMISV